ncbi:MAG TPA: 16S rRNA (adenine(1518)-N(6)/adenine(1519)-N(6))-dimethyltransferase RsmA, partial [Pyrinomonadaceae bacterium]|nr:16S rRNA (adenine(1518)-N(6)/adenine(1519)-N(6))-dimethyltransferase RsmA [Pyrinomonadaceae bacterium]
GKPKNVYAKKSFGQNFLVDGNYISKIISALNPQQNETIIEIGAGRGALTESLIESGAEIIAVELERAMIAVLRERFGEAENFHLIESDALDVDFHETINPKSENRNPKSVKLVANLPFNISTAILQKLIEQRETFSEMVLMFQREVVERITAQVGNPERGFLTVWVEAYLQAEKLFDVPPNAFSPAPKVWSSVVRLKPKESFEIGDEKLFRQIISAGFRQKRKTIYNNLKNFSVDVDLKTLLDNNEINANRRAETLTLEEWTNLCRSFPG